MGIFYNPEILTQPEDYTIGGFNDHDLDKIIVVGNSLRLNMAKIKILFEARITNAINNFLNEIVVSISQKSELEDEDIEEAKFNALSNLFETYLGVKIDSIDTDYLAEIVISNASTQAWFNKISSRINKLDDQLVQTTKEPNSEASVSQGDAEYNTNNSTLEDILQSLSNITELNQI